MLTKNAQFFFNYQLKICQINLANSEWMGLTFVFENKMIKQMKIMNHSEIQLAPPQGLVIALLFSLIQCELAAGDDFG